MFSPLIHLSVLSLCSTFTSTAHPATYTLSLHDALPICYLHLPLKPRLQIRLKIQLQIQIKTQSRLTIRPQPRLPTKTQPRLTIRSEEHTSELQSRFDLVCRLLLEKKKKKQRNEQNTKTQ